MKPRLVDTHCHLHFPPFKTGLEGVLERMRDGNIWAVTVGTSARTSEEGIRFAETHDNVWATVGYHPEHLTSAYFDEREGRPETYAIADIRKLAASSEKVVAIGETGLDFYRIDNDSDVAAAKDKQERALREHIGVADELGLPLVIHCRDASHDLARIVSDETTHGKSVRGVVHCFTGTWEEAEPLLDLGLHLSFTGIITFPEKKSADPGVSVHRVIERMPMERLMVETDAPWLAPEPYRGKQNEPSYVAYVAEKIAELRNIPLDDVEKKTTKNAISFFGLKP